MTIIGLVAAGLGVSILPASFQRVQLNEMRWVPIDEQDAVSKCGWCGRNIMNKVRLRVTFVFRLNALRKASIIEAKKGPKMCG